MTRGCGARETHSLSHLGGAPREAAQRILSQGSSMKGKLTIPGLFRELGFPPFDTDQVSIPEIRDLASGNPRSEFVECVSTEVWETCFFVQRSMQLVYVAETRVERFALVGQSLERLIFNLVSLREETRTTPTKRMLRAIYDLDPRSRSAALQASLADLEAFSRLEVDLSRLAAPINSQLSRGRVRVEVEIAQSVAAAMSPFSPGWAFGKTTRSMATGREPRGRVAVVFAFVPVWVRAAGRWLADAITVGVRAAEPDQSGVALPDAAWPELGPWSPLRVETDPFKKWAETHASDRISIPYDLALAWINDRHAAISPTRLGLAQRYLEPM